MKLHRAAASRKLFVILTLTALAAGGFAIVRMRAGSSDPASKGEMTLYCPKCGEQHTNDPKWQGSKFLCPNCNEYIASYEDPNATPPGIGTLP